ncbi:MAG: 50S ribosomal protein L18 [Candidatus Niyogibacteria bacterium]|nr:50S ribosomal protein L18 [Candidatus Niyogibacteria bacterium]
MSLNIKIQKKIRRHKRVRSRILGRSGNPRLSVFRANKHIYAQIIDDEKGRTLIGLSDAALENKKGDKSAKARALGLMLAQLAKRNKIKKVVFDRGGYRYHGRIRALAEGAREGGLEF